MKNTSTDVLSGSKTKKRTRSRVPSFASVKKLVLRPDPELGRIVREVGYQVQQELLQEERAHSARLSRAMGVIVR